MRSTLRAVAALVLVLAVAACGDDTGTATGNSAPQPSSAGGDATTTTEAEATSTTAAAPLRLTPEALGDLRLGMTTAEATATGMVGAFTPSCEIAGQGQQAAPLLAPLTGNVFTTGGTVSHLDVRAGAVTDPAGVAPGDDVEAATEAFEAAGYDVELDKSLADVFAGTWFLRVTAGGEAVFGATVSAETGALAAVSVPSTLTCE